MLADMRVVFFLSKTFQNAYIEHDCYTILWEFYHGIPSACCSCFISSVHLFIHSFSEINAVCCVGSVSIQIEKEKGWRTADMDSKV